MGDYKYAIQVIADDLAFEQYGRDFYDLDDDTRSKIYDQALDRWIDKVATMCDRD